MTASLAWLVSGPPGTAAGDNKSEALKWRSHTARGAGALHGLGKRGKTVGIVNHGARAWASREAASPDFSRGVWIEALKSGIIGLPLTDYQPLRRASCQNRL
jgi:hypothetical protein